MSYAYRIGRKTTEWAAGRQWTFGRFTRTVWAELAEEARRSMPDPIRSALDALADATLKDAEIIRKLTIADEAEAAKAAIEGRSPVLMAPQYTPLSREIADEAYRASRRYLSAGSPELTSWLMSHEGCSFLLWCLLKQHQPEVTLDEAYDVYWDLATNPFGPNGRPADGRKTPDAIINICNGTAAEPAKNEESPA